MKNSKSRIAIAIATALGTLATGSAFAQNSSVQIGGSLNLFYSQSDGGSGQHIVSGKKHDNLSLSEPELYIHGEEKLGGGMTAWFRCTSSFDLMGTGAQGTAGQLCGRNSALGFKGSFGNVFAGTWDTPAKLVGGQIRGWFGGTASLTGGFASALYNGSGSNTGNTGATFWERRARSISYHSPDFNGFNFKAMVSAANEETALTTTAQQALSPRTMGLSLEYSQGPLYVGLGYESHKDFNPFANGIRGREANGATAVLLASVALGAGAGAYNGGTDDSWTLGARYQLGKTRLSGLYSRTTYDVAVGQDLKRDGYAFFVDHQLSGPHSIKAQYFVAKDLKGSLVTTANNATGAAVTDTGAKGWTLAYMYDFSKRTQAGFVYGVLDNDRNSGISKGVTTAALGSTQKVYGLNLRHRF